MKTWHSIAIGLFSGLLITGLILFLFLPEKGEPITLNARSEKLPGDGVSINFSNLMITVHMAGEVVRPGVYELPVGSDLADAITAAGGLTDFADPNLLNLASTLEDGSRKYIPPVNLDTASKTSAGDFGDSLININFADVNTLISLPGIGETKAKAIVDYRNEHGLFTNLEELLNVQGIGTSIFSSIKELITLGP